MEITINRTLPGKEVWWIFGLCYFEYLLRQVSTKQGKIESNAIVIASNGR